MAPDRSREGPSEILSIPVSEPTRDRCEPKNKRTAASRATHGTGSTPRGRGDPAQSRVPCLPFTQRVSAHGNRCYRFPHAAIDSRTGIYRLYGNRIDGEGVSAYQTEISLRADSPCLPGPSKRREGCPGDRPRPSAVWTARDFSPVAGISVPRHGAVRARRRQGGPRHGAVRAQEAARRGHGAADVSAAPWNPHQRLGIRISSLAGGRPGEGPGPPAAARLGEAGGEAAVPGLGPGTALGRHALAYLAGRSAAVTRRVLP